MTDFTELSRAAARHTRIVDTVMMHSLPILMRWPHPNPLCDFLCHAQPHPLPEKATVAEKISVWQRGETALRIALADPALPRSARSEMAEVIGGLVSMREALPRLEEELAPFFEDFDAGRPEIETLSDIADSLRVLRRKLRGKPDCAVGVDVALAMLEDGADTIYDPRHPYYRMLGMLDRVGPSKTPTDPQDVPDVQAKGFLGSIGDALSSAADYVLDTAWEDVKGAAVGAGAGALGAWATGGGSAAAGAVVGGAAKSGAKVVEDTEDSVKGKGKGKGKGK
ncbi:hypothetical protein [Antarctobacter heliothermus]|uniref:Uncharacterized protein n=1 Tax=Antarctobacter heliothermus TaxID=74033 RepID=A0A239G484_9RHOB|nr:hypothetical protein [Antarctobacter heliothermus]SNS63815.1 hypothetical protein SAMN04488078_102415 [Antarctobacter heliothermus]